MLYYSCRSIGALVQNRRLVEEIVASWHGGVFCCHTYGQLS